MALSKAERRARAKLRRAHVKQQEDSDHTYAMMGKMYKALSHSSSDDWRRKATAKWGRGATKEKRGLCFHKHLLPTKPKSRFGFCTRCGFMRAIYTNKTTPEQLALKLPAILANKVLPPGWNTNSYVDTSIHPLLKVRRSRVFEDSWELLVQFPKGWVCSASFSTWQYDRVWRALQPHLLKCNPVQMHEAAHLEIYGHPAAYRYRTYV